MAQYLSEKEIVEAFRNSNGFYSLLGLADVECFPNIYDCEFLEQSYVGDETIEGKQYEKRATWTAYWKYGLDDIPMFKFYTYYCRDDMPDNTVGSYMNASKLYQTDELDLSDFPEWMD